MDNLDKFMRTPILAEGLKSVIQNYTSIMQNREVHQCRIAVKIFSVLDRHIQNSCKLELARHESGYEIRINDIPVYRINENNEIELVQDLDKLECPCGSNDVHIFKNCYGCFDCGRIGGILTFNQWVPKEIRRMEV